MKEIQELKLEDLTIEQKLGMVMHGLFTKDDNWEGFEDNLNYTIELIKKRSLGAVWVSPRFKETQRIMKAVKEAADYPILIFTDAESGLGEYQIGRHNNLGMTGSEDLAYTFGKVTATVAKQMGYNIVCAPVVDMAQGDCACGGTNRSLGSDKEMVAKLGKAIARGMHDCGILTVAKHYPSPTKKPIPGIMPIDSHMAPTRSTITKEDLLNISLYPYKALMEENLMDGVMVAHCSLPEIDPDHPSSLSKKVIDIIRDEGFDGIVLTDALEMMGIKAKYGMDNPPGLAIAAGNDLALTWTTAKEAYERMLKCYEKGLIPDDRLDEAVRRILDAQHKVFVNSSITPELTEEDIEKFNRISTDAVYAKTDDGVSTSIPTDKKHLFVVTVKAEQELNSEGKLTVDTFSNDWFKPALLAQKIEELFPNSTVLPIPQFPSATNNSAILNAAVKHDDVIFVNFADAPAYVGSDHITQRLAALVNALNISESLKTVVHFGNPFVLEDLMHVERLIIGPVSTKSTLAAIEVLAGKREAKGSLTYEVNFN